MKKLKIKVFVTLFSILTIFTVLILFTSFTRDYLTKQKTITDILTSTFKRMDIRDKEDNKKDEKIDNKDKPPMAIPNQNIRKIYLDFTIYTVVLDENGEFKEVINHTSDDTCECGCETLETIAKRIIKNHKDKLFVGNLFTDKFSYVFTPDNTLVIMDNTNTNKMFRRQLIINISILMLCELIIFIITHFITKWITDPVKKTFDKQKIFVADASHELKTPLSVMVASADAYFNDHDEKWVHNMKNESERMIKLVTELLDLAKTEKEQEIIKKDNNLSEIIESSILTFEGLFYENNIKLKYDIEEDIMFNCNENLIIELMSILIDNAIKHCSTKGKVIVNLNKDNKQIILEVKNTGEPINKEDEEKIFERFYKVDSSRNRNSNNYGLGLAIAKNIVEQHNGTISAHSDKKYTTFKIIMNQK